MASNSSSVKMSNKSVSLPLAVLTTPCTSCPSFNNSFAKLGPAKPVMPVIKYFMFYIFGIINKKP